MTLSQEVIVAMALPLVVWFVGRGLVVLAARVPPGPSLSRLYVAGRVDRLRVTTVLAYGDEILVGLAAGCSTELATQAWRVVADASVRSRLERWLDDATELRGYRSADGAIMLADRIWGGNVECEPALAVG